MIQEVDYYSLYDNSIEKTLWIIGVKEQGSNIILLETLFDQIKGHFTFDIDNNFFYVLDSNALITQYQLDVLYDSQIVSPSILSIQLPAT